MDLEQHLLLVHVGAQVALLLALLDGTAHGGVPGQHRARERVAHGARAVVELDGTADVDAARVDFDRGALHPVVEQRTQAGHAARRAHGGEEHFLLEARVVLADHRDLQLLARAEVGEHARLAHAHDVGQRPDGQTLEPDVRGQTQRGIDDGGLGLLPLVQRTLAAAARAGGAGGFGGAGFDGSGHGRRQKRTFVLFCSKFTDPPGCPGKIGSPLQTRPETEPLRRGLPG